MTPDKMLSKACVFPTTASRKFIKDLPWATEHKKGAEAWEGDPRVSGKWGLATGASGLLVLDVDEKNGKSGSASLAQFPALPKTYTVRTPSGGLHYYFVGEGPTSAGQLAEGLDTRGKGGMVKFYDDVVDDSAVAPMPEWLKTWCTKHNSRKAEKGHIDSDIEPDQPSNIRAATKFLKTAAPAIEDQGGDTLTANLAMYMHDFAVTEETALDLMLEHWNPRCEPEWEVDDLAQKIANGFKYAKNDFGSRTEDYQHQKLMKLYGDVEAQNPPPESNPENLKDDDDEWPDYVEPEEEEDDGEGPKRLSALTPGRAPDREWLVHGYIPLNAVTSFYGAPGSGKSLATVELCICVANGRPWFGQQVDHPSPVLLVSCEDDEAEIWRRAEGIRLKDIHQDMAGREDDVYYWDRVGRDSVLASITQAGTVRKKFMNRLEEELKKVAPEGERRTLIIDTLIDTADMNENDRVHVNYFIKFILGGLAIRHNATVIFLAHPSKSSDVSGSTAFRGSVRAQLFLSKVEGHRDLRRITRGKANYSASDEGDDGLMIQWENGAFHTVDHKEFEEELSEVQKRAVFKVLLAATNSENYIHLAGNSRNPIKDHKVLDEFGCEVPQDNMKKLINTLINDGAVVYEKGRGLVATELEF